MMACTNIGTVIAQFSFNQLALHLMYNIYCEKFAEKGAPKLRKHPGTGIIVSEDRRWQRLL